jgi:hypothetical protein
MAQFWQKAQASRLGTAQNIATSTTSAASEAFGPETLRIGDATPTAVTSDTLLPANVPMFFTCTPGQKVSALLGAGTGNLSVTEMS